MAGRFGIVVPYESINYVTNPSFERDLTDWSTFSRTGVSGTQTVARDTSWAWDGGACLKIDRQSGSLEYGKTYSLASASDYINYNDYVTFTFAVKLELHASFYPPAFVKMTLGTNSYEINLGIPDVLNAERMYQFRYRASDNPFTGNCEIEFGFTDDNNYTGALYVDAVSIEVADSSPGSYTHRQMYFDGSSDGCNWQGVEHESFSEKPITVRDVGLVYNATDDYGFVIQSHVGVGVPPVDLISRELPITGDLVVNRVLEKPRLMAFGGALIGTSRDNLLSLRKELFGTIKPDLVGDHKPFVLMYLEEDSDAEYWYVPKMLKIPCYYYSGLEMNRLQGNTEKFNLRFMTTKPVWEEDRNKAVSLSYQNTLSGVDYVIERQEDGTWRSLGTLNDEVYCTAHTTIHASLWYVGGKFTGVGSPNNIAYYNESTPGWDQVSTGANGYVRCMVEGPDGYLYVGGDFTILGGGSRPYICYISPPETGIGLVGTGANQPVYALKFGPDGLLYVGGDLTTLNGTSANKIATWDGTNAAALGTGLNGRVKAIAFLPNGNLVVGGSFTTAGGSSASKIAEWDGSSWSELGGGVTGGDVEDIISLPNGWLVVAGGFSSAGGVSNTDSLAFWTGSQWIALATGATALGTVNLAYDEKRDLILVGNVTAAGGLDLDLCFTYFNGFNFAHADVALSTGVTQLISAIGVHRDKVLLGGTFGSGSPDAYVGTDTTVTVSDSSHRVYPKLVVSHSGAAYGDTAKLKWIENLTTNKRIYFNYEIAADEIVTVDFDPATFDVSSDIKASQINAVLRGSDTGDFYLLPGDNVIRLFIEEDSTGTLEASMQWTPTHYSIDGIV